jgi:TPR repeat protein
MTKAEFLADLGYAGAQFNLGATYYNGEGVPQDYVEAHKWRNLAASRASAEDRETFAEARDAVAKLMTPAQIAEAQKLASEWHAAFDARQE